MCRCENIISREARIRIVEKYRNFYLMLRLNKKVNEEHESKVNEWAEMVLET